MHHPRVLFLRRLDGRSSWTSQFSAARLDLDETILEHLEHSFDGFWLCLDNAVDVFLTDLHTHFLEDLLVEGGPVVSLLSLATHALVVV